MNTVANTGAEQSGALNSADQNTNIMTEVQLPRLQMQQMLGKSRLVAHGKTLSAIPRVGTPRTATSGMLNSSEATNNYQSHANTLMVSSGRVSTAVNT